MLLGEVMRGSTVLIRSTRSIDAVEYNTKIVSMKDGRVLLEPVREEGLVINFFAERVKTNIYYIDEQDNTYVFKNVYVSNEYDENGSVLHSVSANIVGEVMNRRSTLRYVINKPCIFTPGKHRPTENAVIRDISLVGAAIVSMSEIDIGEICRFTLNNRDGFGMTNIEVKVIRKFTDVMTGRNLYGCTFVRESTEIAKYVMEIERLRIKANSGRR